MEYTRHSKGFKELFVACKFVAKGTFHYAITLLHVDETQLRATDGHRAIRTENVYGLEPGFYEVATCTKSKIMIYPKEIEANFPSFEDVFPKESKPDEPQMEMLVMVNQCKSTMENLSMLGYTLAKHSKCINLEFAKPFLDAGADFKMGLKDDYSPIYFKSANAEALIMPLNYEYELDDIIQDKEAVEAA